jgi:hypothetical protein
MNGTDGIQHYCKGWIIWMHTVKKVGFSTFWGCPYVIPQTLKNLRVEGGEIFNPVTSTREVDIQPKSNPSLHGFHTQRSKFQPSKATLHYADFIPRGRNSNPENRPIIIKYRVFLSKYLTAPPSVTQFDYTPCCNGQWSTEVSADKKNIAS